MHTDPRTARDLAISIETLLSLQQVDLRIDQLLRQRAELPERSAIAFELEKAADTKKVLDEATSAHDAAAVEQHRLDTELKEVDKRIASINARLYGSNPVGAKDAQAMAGELEHLTARQSQLVDAELEVLEQLDDLQRRIAVSAEDAKPIAVGVAELQSRLKAAESDLDAQLAAQRLEREPLVGEVTPDLLRRYEDLRSRLGGIAIAQLEGRRCGGCHLELAGGEVDRLRRESTDKIPACEECARMLVVRH